MNRLESYFEEMESGDTVYLNVINATIEEVDTVRELVKAGKLVPDGKELTQVIVSEALHRYFSGESIAPQMSYIKA